MAETVKQAAWDGAAVVANFKRAKGDVVARVSQLGLAVDDLEFAHRQMIRSWQDHQARQGLPRDPETHADGAVRETRESLRRELRAHLPELLA